MKRFLTLGLTLLIPIAMVSSVYADFELIRGNQPRAVIVLPESPEKAELEAAEELIEHFALITEVTFQTIAVGGDMQGLTPIRIGKAADEAIETLIRKKSDDPWAFALIVDKHGVQLRGLSPEGTRTAAYELLEQLGVRWFMPGKTGRVLPSSKSLILKDQETVQAPAFSFRHGPSGSDVNKAWSRRMRLPGVGGRYGAHGIPPLRGSAVKGFFEKDPRLFALVNGERKKGQLCLTYSTNDIAGNQTLAVVVDHCRELLRANPEQIVLNMGPNDGSSFCECEQCTALDPPSTYTVPLMTPGPSYTDRYVWFFNQLTEALKGEFPKVRVGFYAYAGLQMPPLVVEPRNNLAISLAPIHTCRIHGPNNPICPESNFPIWLLEHWKPYVGEFIADRGYLFNLACPGFPFSMVHRVRVEIPAFYDRGVRIWSADASSAWASHNPSMYIAAKLLWNPAADVDAMLEEFYTGYYGPASVPMAAYHTFMDATIRDADHHTGGSWDMPLIYPEEVRQHARGLLVEAMAQIADKNDSIYAQRVEITRVALDFLDGYCELMRRRFAFDFLGEMKMLESIEAIRDRLLNDYEFPMLNAYHANGLLSRFIRRMTADSAATLEGGGRVIVPLSYAWQFQTDPEGWGQYIGLQEAESEGGNWQTLRSDTSWSNQGLRYYFGQCWYRQTIDFPDTHKNEEIHLWFAGVDRTAEVWINGQFAGANHGGAEFDLDAFGSSFSAFEFDVSKLVRHGEPNVITVRVDRPGTAELGTGGIIGPAMFYIPGK